MKPADEYFDRIAKLPSENLSQLGVGPTIAGSRGVYFAATERWEESNQVFEKLLMTEMPAFAEISFRTDYAWALERQGRFEEARVQRDQVQKLFEQVEERFGHAKLQLGLMVPRRVQVGEEFEMRLDLVNVGRKPGALVKIAGAVPAEFKVVGLPSFCSLQNGSLAMKEKSVGPFQVETVKLQVNVTKAGGYSLNPEVSYVDDLGTTKTFSANSITIIAQPVKPAYEALPGRITTGYVELDKLLLGGIPEKYAVVLAAPSSDERQLLVGRFLEAGAKAGEATLYVTCEATNVQDLAKQFQTHFYLVVCSLQADLFLQSLPNVYKLKGIDNLTDIDIALTKYFRTLDPSQTAPRRACIDIVSDVLLQHHAVVTRKWLSALLPNLKSQGFTILAVMNPSMHSQEEVQAVLGLFQGEINISERETGKGLQQILRIRKLYNQKFLENELILDKGRRKQEL